MKNTQLTIILCTTFIGCVIVPDVRTEFNPATSKVDEKEIARTNAAAAPTIEKQSLGADTFEIIRDEMRKGIKRTVEVRLSERLSEQELQLLAHRLKAKSSQEVPRTFITYYLPGMEVGKGAWASSHFTPELRIRIWGPTKDQLENVLTIDDNDNRLGQWIDNGPFAGIITIFERNGDFFAERHFKDGSIVTQDLIRQSSSDGQRFDVKEDSFKAYYIIDRKGNLRVGDQDGLIKTLTSRR